MSGVCVPVGSVAGTSEKRVGGSLSGVAMASTSVTATPTNNSVVLDWYAVTNATRYFVYRNNLGCDAGFTKVATVTAPTVTYTDNSVVNGVVYYYRIQAAAASDACFVFGSLRSESTTTGFVRTSSNCSTVCGRPSSRTWKSDC